MALIKRNDAETIADVIRYNTGATSLAELDGKSSYFIKGLSEAAAMIKESIAKKELITIIGDYDADGVTSTCIMETTLNALGANVRSRIPHRMSEGFGLNMNIIDEIDSGLAITVDNGIVAFDPIKKAKEKGLKVIITDHHEPDQSGALPEADIIIDPHLPGTADFENYCGAGIAFKLCKELTNDETLIAKLSCFAAIGTVADVMPLVEENRQIVKEGLKNMTNYGTRTTGLYSILHAVDMEKNICATDIAFKIGPMINACGRLFDDGAKIALEALAYDGPYKEEIGQQMNDYNDLRKKKVKEGLEAVYNNISMNCLHGDTPLVVYEPTLEEGIIGIIAGRLAEEKQVPAFVFTNAEVEGIYKGSGRTAGNVNIKDLLDKCSDTLYKYGGHEEAAGVSVEASKFEDMKIAMQDNCPELVGVTDDGDTYYDLEIKAADIAATLDELRQYEPFGQGNPKPVFLIKDFQLSPRYSSTYKTMGENGEHLKLFGIGCCAVGFDMVDYYHGLSDPQKLDLVGVISENFFMGRSEVQVEIQYMDEAKASFTKSLLAQKLEEMAKSRY